MRRWVFVLAVVLLAACEPDPQDQPLPTMLVLPTETPFQPTSTPSPQDLPFYETMSGEIAAGDSDLWLFEGAQGDPIRVRAVSASLVPHLTLIDSKGGQIVSGGDIEAILPGDDIYTVRVEAAQGEGAYQLGLSYADQTAPSEPTLTPLPHIVGIPTPTPLYAGLGSFISELRDGETVPSEFAPASQPQVFTFTANSGQFARITLDPINGQAALLMMLYSPDGVPLAADSLSDNGTGGVLRDIALVDTGTYSLRVESDGQPGTYTLALNLRDVPAPVTPTYHITPTSTLATPVLTPEYADAVPGDRLSPDTPVIAELLSPHDINTHSFGARMGDVITVAVSPLRDSPLIPRVELIDPDGEPVTTVIGNLSPTDREAVISPLITELEGPYTLFVTGEGETSGGYTVSFGYGSTREFIFKGEAPPDRANLSALTRRGTTDVWHITLAQGDLISAGVTPLDGNIFPVLEVYSGTGQLLGIDSEGGGPRSPFIAGVRAPQNGLYLLRVRPATANAIGGYQLVWRYLDLGPTPTPIPGTLPILTVEDTVAAEAFTFYPFQGREGQKLMVAVEAADGSALDPVAALIGLDGTVLAEGDDNAGTLDAYFEAVLPEDGTYQVRVNGYLSSGAFRVTVTAVF